MSTFIDGKINLQGFVSSLTASIDYLTSWMNVIESAVYRCYDNCKFLTFVASVS